MKLFKNIFKVIFSFIGKLDRDKVGPFSAQSAFFFILSVFPLFMLLLSIMKYTPLTEAHLVKLINEIFPSALANSFNNIINETYDKSNIALISFSGLATLWTASKGVASITFGFSNIYGNDGHKRNYFAIRFLSTLYTIIFIFSILLTLTLVVFGNSLMNFFASKSELLFNISAFLIDIRSIYVPLFLTLIFTGIYLISCPQKASIRSQLPGAVFSSLGWTGFSYLFSLYVDNFNNYSYVYGSITTIILLMIWIYICIYIMFLGLEINIFFKKFFIRLRNNARKKLNKKKEEPDS